MGVASCESAVASVVSVVTSVVVRACVVSSSLDEAGVSFVVMRAPWTLCSERHRARPERRGCCWPYPTRP